MIATQSLNKISPFRRNSKQKALETSINTSFKGFYLMRKMRLELTRGYPHKNLNLARLPFRHFRNKKHYTFCTFMCQFKSVYIYLYYTYIIYIILKNSHFNEKTTFIKKHRNFFIKVIDNNIPK